MNQEDMVTKCRFVNCRWIGLVKNLFKHCEDNHRALIVQINDENFFSFTFDDIYEYTFLLIGHNCMYWFLRKPERRIRPSVKRGIFAISEQDVDEFTVVIGRHEDGHVMSFGPCDIHPDGSNDYELILTSKDFEDIEADIPSRTMKIYFGPCNITQMNLNRWMKEIAIQPLPPFSGSTCLNGICTDENCPLRTSIVEPGERAEHDEMIREWLLSL